MASFLMKPQEWLDRIESGGGAGHPKVALMLRDYEALDKAPMDKKLAHLAKVHKVAVDGERAGGVHATTFALLGISEVKERESLERQAQASARARQNWGAAKRVFTTLDARMGKGTRELIPAYWLEAIDARHRSWGHINMLIKGHTAGTLLAAWQQGQSEENFWEWCKRVGLDSAPSVQYLAPDTRWRYMVEIADNKKLRILDAERKLVPLSTLQMSTAFSGANVGIWVVSQTGVFFTHSHAVSQFHHSSFLAGKPVLCAGEWMVRKGDVTFLSHKTGHYQASAEDLVRLLRQVEGKVDLSLALCELNKYEGHDLKGVKYLMAADLLKAGDPKDAPVLTPQDFVAWKEAASEGGFEAGVAKIEGRRKAAEAAGTLGKWDGEPGKAGARVFAAVQGLVADAAHRRMVTREKAARRAADLKRIVNRCARFQLRFEAEDFMVLARFRGAQIESWQDDDIAAMLQAARLKLDFDEDGAGLTDIETGILFWRAMAMIPLPEPDGA